MTPAPAPPPQLPLPLTATEHCKLPVLPANPTTADLAAGYASRGMALVNCDAARQLAVTVHEEEHRLEGQWAEQRAARNRPWWQVWKPRGVKPSL